MARKQKTASRPDTWMPIYWGDYFKDTGHLSTSEHGAYLLMIGHYWTRGRALPDDDAKLAQITRQSIGAWKKMRATLAEFFTLERGAWMHGRIEDELTRAFDFIEKQRENGAKGGRPQKPNGTQPKPTAFGWDTPRAGFQEPKPNPPETTSPSSNESSSSEISTDPPRDAALGGGSAPRGSGSVHERVARLAEVSRRKFAGSA